MAHTYRDIPSAGTTLDIMLSYVYTNIPGCTDISVDGYGRAVRNPTHLASPAVVKKPGLANFGQLKCKVFYDPNDATHQALFDRIQDSAADASANLDQFQVTWADGFATPAHLEFYGFVSSFSPSATDPETGTVTCDTTIEITSIIDNVAGQPYE